MKVEIENGLVRVTIQDKTYSLCEKEGELLIMCDRRIKVTQQSRLKLWLRVK